MTAQWKVNFVLEQIEYLCCSCSGELALKNLSTKVSNYKISLYKGRQNVYTQTLPRAYRTFSAQ